MQVIEGAVIACAGLGSRLGMGMPKCMIEIDGKTLLSRLIEILEPLVARIHIVVGYREELIIDHCSQYHRNVIVVRNPEYRGTNTAHSIQLGSVGIKNKALYLDGDLIIDPSSLQAFIAEANKLPLLIGVTRAKSSEAVFVTTGKREQDKNTIYSFQRQPETQWEWANVFSSAPALLKEGGHFVYECIEPYLPTQVHELNLYEVDTPEDLQQAIIWTQENKL